MQYLIEKILAHQRSNDFFFLLDPRFEKPEDLRTNFAVVSNKMMDRLRFYRQRKNDFTRVLCFANIPPPIRLKAQVFTYSHNQKLLEAPKQKFNRRYLRLYLKYLVIKLFNRNTDYYIVQTPHMVDELTSLGLKDPAHCLQIPFYDDGKYTLEHKAWKERVKDEFVFISNPSPQKNHTTLFDAWEQLLGMGYRPLLHVTIDHTGPQLLSRIEHLNNKGARILNHVYTDPRALYYSCPYLIFPSVMESFGLPLIEAADSGMKVLASNLAYVYDVVTPSLTFEPGDKNAIAQAVITALHTELPVTTVVTRNEIAKLLGILVV